ncbi:hypothetical protein FH972_010788 [Carpinus fangiana]|uniref:Histone deacetylase complex subunit SAP30 Sin3 binding domain-containing protein n=1 Tax=Carpinus fangiana TaxID=176857 RepID=A0A660KRC7_9ROSI|nr:hypothetical protein FH972_010788 [Carpinus fangiana]
MITDIQCYFFLFVVSSLISTLLIRSIFNKPTGLHLMPSPPALPIIGHLQYLFFTPSLYNSLHRLSTKYGPLLYLRLGATRCVVVSSATLAAEIFTTHDLAFASRPIFAFADKLQFETSRFFTAPYGDYWRFMKKLSKVELSKLEMVALWRYWGYFNLVDAIPNPSKEQLVDVQRHFMSQQMDELQVILGFVRAVN